MPKFIWITGHSAVGKDTFARAFCANPAEWSRRLEIDPCLDPKYLIDPSIQDAERAGELHDTVIMKWQSLGFCKVYELTMRNPDAEHIVVHINRPLDEHRRDFATKHRGQRFEHGIHVNVTRAEAYRNVVDVFVNLANIGGNFHVVGRTKRER